MNIQTSFSDGLYTIELSGEPDPKDTETAYKERWQEILAGAKEAKAILMLNYVDFVMSSTQAYDLLDLYKQCKQLKAVANVKFILPEVEEVEVYTFIDKMADDIGIKLQTFYLKEEAEEWLADFLD